MAAVTNNSVSQALDPVCEQIIAQFEQATNVDALEFVEAIIAKVEPALRPAFVTELARIDLERTFADEYLSEVRWKASRFYTAMGSLFQSTSARSELAFEHYRLARLHGAAVTKDEIGQLYQIDTHQWKELPTGNPLALKLHVDPEFPRIGESFSGYPLIAELGRGALARVYLARQTDLAGRLVVLKITTRLSAEADKLARLQHSNIVPVYSVHRGGDNKQLFGICMPYLGSLTLADLLVLFESRSQNSSKIEELISTLVARRRSTLISTIKQQHSPADSSTPASVDAASPSGQSIDSAEANGATQGLPSKRLDRQLGYDELMGALHSLVQQPNDIQSACRLMEGVASGMAYAHSLGIVHRDLKPENILIANDARPVILDFNLSDEPAGARPTLVGGTLPYMSLQQLQSLDCFRRACPADDVFSIGTIFYRLLTGQLPYPNRTIDHLNQLIEDRRQAPVSLTSLAPKVPPSLASIVMKCLATEEQHRYPTATELLEDLNCFREYRPLRHAPDRSIAEHFKRFAQRNPVVTSSSFLSLVAGSLLLLVSLSWWWNSQRTEQLSQQLALKRLQASLPGVLAQLHGPFRDAPQLKRGLETGTQLLGQWSLSQKNLDMDKRTNRLDEQELQQCRQQLGQLIFAMASAEANLGLIEGDRLAHVKAAMLWNRLCNWVSPQLSAACSFQQSQLLPGDGLESLAEDALTEDEADRAPLANLLLARQAGNLEAWLRWADVMVAAQPEDATAWFNLGSANYSAGKYERAWTCFDVATKLQSGSPVSIFWRGITSHQLGDHAAALKDFDQCLIVDPHWYAARHNRALAEFALRQLDVAAKDATELIVSKQAGPRVWLLRSQILKLQGQAEQAESDRQAALSAKCLSADDWVAVGVQQMATDPQAALKAFRTANEIEPANVAGWLNSAHVLSEVLQQPQDAIEAMTRLIALRPREASHYATRGILAARLGQADHATTDAEKAGSLQLTAIEKLQLAGIYSLLAQSTVSDKKVEYVRQGLEWLRQAFIDDPQLVSLADQDPDTETIRRDPIGQELVMNAKALCQTK